MKFSVSICCYGDFSEYSLRAVQSVLSPNRDYEIHIGCNTCGKKTLYLLRKLYDEKRIDTLIESNININRDQMERLLIERTRTEYDLWLDDDSYVLSGWDGAISNFIDRNQPFDAAGQLFVAGRYPEYKELCKQRPWWKDGLGEEDKVYFPVGGLFLFRTDFMRKHDFPDRDMIKHYGDMFLGDLIVQQNGILKVFDENVNSKIVVDAGKRRGSGGGQK